MIPSRPRAGHHATLWAGVLLLTLACPPALAAQDTAPGLPMAAPAATELLVTIVHTSDEHSALLPAPLVDYRPGEADPTRGGFARLAAAVEALRSARTAAGEPVLLTSAGDNIGGTPFAWLALDGAAPELGLMVELGYDVVTLGNHEFDYGPERLAAYLAAAGYPAAGDRTALLATNTRPPPGHALGEAGLRRTHLATLPNGLRVGFLGLIGEDAVRFATEAPPVEFEDGREAAAAAVEALRADGAQVVVAITHAGLAEDRALARAVPGIDVILGGHDHRLLDPPATEGGTVIVHPGAHLAQVAVLELGYDPARGRVRVRNPDTGSPHVVPLDSGTGESPAMAARVAEFRERLERQVAALTGGRFGDLDATVVRSEFALPAGPDRAESPFGDFVTDAMRAAVQRATGDRVDFAFQANGVIRGDLVPGRTGGRRGDVTLHDLAGLVGTGVGPDGRPGYPLVAVWLTGEEVRRVMEVSILLSELLGDAYYLQASGLRARYAPRRAILARIPVRGTPIPTGRALLGLERDAEAPAIEPEAEAQAIEPEARASAGRAAPAGTRYVPLERGDTALYQVVTDRYVASFLPMVGRLVPRLALVPKDRDGRPIDDIDQAIVRRNGEELKVWEAVLEFAAAQPPDGTGQPRIADRYRQPAGRLVAEDAAPLWAWPAGGAALLLGLAGAAILVRRRRARFG